MTDAGQGLVAKCGKCGLPIHQAQAFRHFGTFGAHSEHRCLQLLRDRLETVTEQYGQLIYSVANKYEGESRHETALRYIRERENRGTAEAMEARTGSVHDSAEGDSPEPATEKEQSK